MAVRGPRSRARLLPRPRLLALARLLAATLVAACQAQAAVPMSPPPGSLLLEARNIAYEQSSIDAPAGEPATIWFANLDSSIPHDVHVVDATGSTIVRSEVITGGSISVDLPALPPGTYKIFCDVHPGMTAQLVVQ